MLLYPCSPLMAQGRMNHPQRGPLLLHTHTHTHTHTHYLTFTHRNVHTHTHLSVFHTLTDQLSCLSVYSLETFLHWLTPLQTNTHTHIHTHTPASLRSKRHSAGWHSCLCFSAFFCEGFRSYARIHPKVCCCIPVLLSWLRAE